MFYNGVSHIKFFKVNYFRLSYVSEATIFPHHSVVSLSFVYFLLEVTEFEFVVYIFSFDGCLLAQYLLNLLVLFVEQFFEVDDLVIKVFDIGDQDLFEMLNLFSYRMIFILHVFSNFFYYQFSKVDIGLLLEE